jgi:hypothetical protein
LDDPFGLFVADLDEFVSKVAALPLGDHRCGLPAKVFPLTQSLYNWIQDLEMALENAGRDDRRPEADTNAAAGDLFNRAGFALVAVDARGTGAPFGAREIKRLR